MFCQLTPCSRSCGKLVPNVKAQYANSFVLECLVGLFHGAFVGGNCLSDGIPRHSWAVYPNHPRWSIYNWDEGVIVFHHCSNNAGLCCR